jgi:hypothetical protein
MVTTKLDELKNTSLDLINQVVRQDRRCPTFIIQDWDVRALSDQGIINPDGLYLFEGHGVDAAHPGSGAQPWSLVVKVFSPPASETTPDNLWYWRREVDIYRSGLLERLPGPVRGPRIYAVHESAGKWLVWMEHVKDESPACWTMAQYRFAARELGRWNGRCFKEKIKPPDPWVSHELYRGWTETGDIITGWKEGHGPCLQKGLSKADFKRALALHNDRERYFKVLNSLPQVFSHHDYHRRNLMIRKNAQGQDEMVAVDWAMSGMGPLGGELYALIGSSGLLNEVEPEDMPALEEIVFGEYLTGLRAEGWDGDPQLIRLAYTAWVGVWVGAEGPALIAAWTQPGYSASTPEMDDCQQEELAIRFGKLCHFALSRADEAREQIDARAAAVLRR